MKNEERTGTFSKVPYPHTFHTQDTPKLSPFWAQKNFHTFEITERLEDELTIGGTMELDDAFTDDVCVTPGS